MIIDANPRFNGVKWWSASGYANGTEHSWKCFTLKVAILYIAYSIGLALYTTHINVSATF